MTETIVLFDILGPYEVPSLEGAAGKNIGPVEGRMFFAAYPAPALKKGCYVFGVRSGRGITPVYVGKATRSFDQ